MKKTVMVLLCCLRFVVAQNDSSKLELRFANLLISAATADYDRAIPRIGPDVKLEFTFGTRLHSWVQIRNAAWYDPAYADYSNKHASVNLIYAESTKKYLNTEAGVAWNFYSRNIFHAGSAGLIATTLPQPLYYESGGKYYVAEYSLKQEVNNALPDTIWSNGISGHPAYNDSASLYGVSTVVSNVDVFAGYRLRTGYNPEDEWFNDGDDPEFSEYYFDVLVNIRSKAKNLVFAGTEFRPQFVKHIKAGFRAGWTKHSQLLFGLYYGIELGMSPGYSAYDAETIDASGNSKARFLSSGRVLLRLGCKIGAPTRFVKKHLG